MFGGHAAFGLLAPQDYQPERLGPVAGRYGAFGYGVQLSGVELFDFILDVVVLDGRHEHRMAGLPDGLHHVGRIVPPVHYDEGYSDAAVATLFEQAPYRRGLVLLAAKHLCPQRDTLSVHHAEYRDYAVELYGALFTAGEECKSHLHDFGVKRMSCSSIATITGCRSMPCLLARNTERRSMRWHRFSM